MVGRRITTGKAAGGRSSRSYSNKASQRSYKKKEKSINKIETARLFPKKEGFRKNSSYYIMDEYFSSQIKHSSVLLIKAD